MAGGKTLRKITAKRQRRAAAMIDRDHELVLMPQRLREDVMIYRTADGQERSARCWITRASVAGR